MNNLTVLIPTSPIPSHPSTAIIDETIANIRKYTDAKIIIMCDGIHSSLDVRRKDYLDYVAAITKKSYESAYGDCVVFGFHEHVHQAIMTRYVLGRFVTTPLIMFCEHDTSPIGEIPFEKLCWFVGNSHINHLRFNIFDQIPQDHQYLMLDKEPVNWGFNSGLRIVRTIQWSQRPHIAKADWYRDILKTYFSDRKSMIEDVMHSVVQTSYSELGMDKFGLAIYTPVGNQLRSYHSDGRGVDEKIIEA